LSGINKIDAGSPISGEPGIGVVGFNDDRTGIAVCSYGLIVITDNGGKTWNKSGCSGGYYDLDSLDIMGSHAWTAGELDFRVSSDAGRTWTVIPHYGGEDIQGHYISFCDINTGWFATGEHLIGRESLWSTSDNGINWKSISVPEGCENRIMAIQCLDENSGFICTREGLVFKTENRGIQWTKIRLPLGNRIPIDYNPGFPVHAIRFISDERGIVVFYFSKPRGFIIFETIDGGKSWRESVLPGRNAPSLGSVYLSRDGNTLVIYDVNSESIFRYRRKSELKRRP